LGYYHILHNGYHHILLTGSTLVSCHRWCSSWSVKATCYVFE
jgi:hypothetical protein